MEAATPRKPACFFCLETQFLCCSPSPPTAVPTSSLCTRTHTHTRARPHTHVHTCTLQPCGLTASRFIPVKEQKWGPVILLRPPRRRSWQSSSGRDKMRQPSDKLTCLAGPAVFASDKEHQIARENHRGPGCPAEGCLATGQRPVELWSSCTLPGRGKPTGRSPGHPVTVVYTLIWLYSVLILYRVIMNSESMN